MGSLTKGDIHVSIVNGVIDVAGAFARAAECDGAASVKRTSESPTSALLDQRLLSELADPGSGAVATFIGTTRNNFNGRKVLRLEYEAYIPMALKQMVTIAEEAAAMSSKWMAPCAACSHAAGAGDDVSGSDHGHGHREGQCQHHHCSGTTSASSHDSQRLRTDAADPQTARAMDATTAPDHHLRRVILVHRVGIVPVGQASILILVTAAHRGPAMSACRYIIDEVKARVAVWKKEIYLDQHDGEDGSAALPAAGAGTTAPSRPQEGVTIEVAAASATSSPPLVSAAVLAAQWKENSECTWSAAAAVAATKAGT